MNNASTGLRLARLLSAFSMPAGATPAAWHRWRSPNTERDIGAPGDAWN